MRAAKLILFNNNFVFKGKQQHLITTEYKTKKEEERVTRADHFFHLLEIRLVEKVY